MNVAPFFIRLFTSAASRPKLPSFTLPCTAIASQMAEIASATLGLIGEVQNGLRARWGERFQNDFCYTILTDNIS